MIELTQEGGERNPHPSRYDFFFGDCKQLSEYKKDIGNKL